MAPSTQPCSSSSSAGARGELAADRELSARRKKPWGVGQYSLALQHYDKEVRTMNASQRDHVAFLLGRVMLGGMYLYSGITNVIELQGKAGYAASKGLPAPALFVTLASLLLVAGGMSIVTGLRPRPASPPSRCSSSRSR
jgi:hypothetical protein